MSVSLQPSNSLGFNRSFLSPLSLSLPYPRYIGPLTQNVKRSLNITNPNADPVSFKIKTTAPKVRHLSCPVPSLPLIFFP
jgi:vesicle-associated membrane protein-associated protein A